MPFFPQFSNLFVPPYVPAPLPAPYAWYKADVGVTESGGEVTQWDDQSGNDRHLLVGGGATSPNYISSGINSLPSIEFAEDMNLQLANDDTTIKTIVSVVRTAPTIEGYQAIVECSGGGLYTSLVADEFGSYWKGFTSYTNLNSESDYILSVRIAPDYDANAGGDTFGYVNDTSYTATGAGFQGRSNITVGNNDQFNQPINGYISELILFDVILTEEQLLSYISNMNTKYAIY
jgi:hypothetical protein